MVDFGLFCLFCFMVIIIDNKLSPNILLFSCNLIGQLCLGGPGYSNRTVTGSCLVSGQNKDSFN